MKPFEEQLASLNVPSTLNPLFDKLDPKPGFLRIWPEEDEDIPLVETKYGLVPRGSVLSYQQQQTSKRSSENPAHPVPNFDLPDLGFPPTVLTEKELLHFNSLAVSLDQALEYEQITRDQSMSRDWHRLRKYRLTASNFKVICSRRKDHESLSACLLQRKVVQTAAMRYGIQHEDEAAYISMQINLEGLFIRLVLLSILPYRTLVVVLTEEFMTPLKMSNGDY